MKLKSTFLVAAACGAIALGGCAKSSGDGNSMASGNAVSANSADYQGPAPLTLAGSTDFPGYTGDFDHFAIDTKDNKVFVAGEEFHEVEVLDRDTGKLLQRLTGYALKDRQDCLISRHY